MNKIENCRMNMNMNMNSDINIDNERKSELNMKAILEMNYYII